eukprot:TRINITY_DN4482_c1_g1_i1.p1 TRINITY_DN4482_c1_g1~~TRINITY_DN4482_c1_g1_i1.p1  ORF type:complete len:741 (-),score=142.17 TRINITY_DN4482_c1_g1_i1:81-2153(-)
MEGEDFRGIPFQQQFDDLRNCIREEREELRKHLDRALQHQCARVVAGVRDAIRVEVGSHSMHCLEACADASPQNDGMQNDSMEDENTGDSPTKMESNSMIPRQDTSGQYSLRSGRSARDVKLIDYRPRSSMPVARRSGIFAPKDVLDPTLRTSRLEAFVDGPWFESITLFAIMASTAAIGVQAELSLRPHVPQTDLTFKYLEVSFCLIFVLEIVLKGIVYGRRFFKGKESGWNIFTVFLVACQVIELITGSLTERFLDEADSTRSGSTSIPLRIVRILRVARIARAVRLVGIVQGLRTIVASVLGSLRHVCWTIIALITGVYAVAVAITQMVGDAYERCDGGDAGGSECPEHVQLYFGSLFDSCLTLFASVTSGVDWYNPVRVLWDDVSVIAFIFLIAYITFVLFALVNAVTGVFVDSAMRAADKAQAQALTGMADRIFFKTDKDQLGSIDRRSFMNSLKNDEMKQYFAMLDVSISEAEKLFDIIDADGSGTLEMQEFIDGVLRLKGPAKSLDFLSFLMMWRDSHWELRDEMKNLVEITRGCSARISATAASQREISFSGSLSPTSPVAGSSWLPGFALPPTQEDQDLLSQVPSHQVVTPSRALANQLPQQQQSLHSPQQQQQKQQQKQPQDHHDQAPGQHVTWDTTVDIDLAQEPSPNVTASFKADEELATLTKRSPISNTIGVTSPRQ